MSTKRTVDPKETTVLVTGASGFIGMHCVLQLLEQGYLVRGTVRSRAKETELRETLAQHTKFAENFSVAEADLTNDEGWAEAASGCRFALHVASPIPRVPPAHEDELIVPAREGALRVLRACSDAGVERVVMTSSTAAVLYGRDRSKIFDESDWSVVDSPKIGAYEKSKTLAEQAAWDFIESLPESVNTDSANTEGGGEQRAKLELAVINPGLVLGPILNADYGTSGEVVKKLMDRDFPAVPNFNWSLIDVRDVAAAHLAAMTVPEAAGHRHICAISSRGMGELAKVLAKHTAPLGFKVPTGRLPSFVVRIVALFDKTARLGLNDLDVEQKVDNSRLRNVLGIEPRGLEEMTIAMADSLIEYGVVSAK